MATKLSRPRIVSISNAKQRPFLQENRKKFLFYGSAIKEGGGVKGVRLSKKEPFSYGEVPTTIKKKITFFAASLTNTALLKCMALNMII